jgi:hypothetical protein
LKADEHGPSALKKNQIRDAVAGMIKGGDFGAALPLTLSLFRWESEQPGMIKQHRSRLGFAVRLTAVLPLPVGEGRGEGEFRFPTFVALDLIL